MHKSRIDGIFIDHPPESFAASVAFWASATGRSPHADEPYHSFGTFGGDIVIEAQRVGKSTAPRVHLDVATDDIDAEVQRLEKLGATKLQQCDGYWQMRDPGGLVFCVISPHTDDFAETAVSWD
jgi:hypothetical protein